MNKIFIISGPSGVGKTTVAKGVLKKLPELKTTVTFTTRTERLGKLEDKIVKHISPAKFKEKIKQGDFLEWAVVHENLYGTDKNSVLDQLEKNNILMNIDVQGALQIKEKMPAQTKLIFIKAESVEELAKRIAAREKMPEQTINIRLKNAAKELALVKKYDYEIMNKRNEIKKTISEVVKIIKKQIIKTHC